MKSLLFHPLYHLFQSIQQHYESVNLRAALRACAKSSLHSGRLRMRCLKLRRTLQLQAGAPFSAAPGCLPHDPAGTSHSFFSY